MQRPIKTEQDPGKHDELTKAIIGVFYDVYNELGSGFVESVYKECIELKVGDGLVKEHETQTLNYLRATDLEVALLMNFRPMARFRRLAMDNEKKNNKSTASVEIGVMPFVDEAVTEWV